MSKLKIQLNQPFLSCFSLSVYRAIFAPQAADQARRDHGSHFRLIAPRAKLTSRLVEHNRVPHYLFARISSDLRAKLPVAPFNE